MPSNLPLTTGLTAQLGSASTDFSSPGVEIQHIPLWGITAMPRQSRPSPISAPNPPSPVPNGAMSARTLPGPTTGNGTPAASRSLPQIIVLDLEIPARERYRSGTDQIMSAAFNTSKAKSHQCFRDHKIN